MTIYKTHEDEAKAHNDRFIALLVQAETLNTKIQTINDKISTTDTWDDTVYEQWRQIQILEIEAWETYTEAQLHLLAADKHTQKAKVNASGQSAKVIDLY